MDYYKNRITNLICFLFYIGIANALPLEINAVNTVNGPMCGELPCMPGFQQLCQLNMDTGSSSDGQPLIAWTFNNGNTYHDTHKNITYAYPDQVKVIDASGSFTGISSGVYNTDKELQNSMSTSVHGSIGLGSLFSASVEVTETKRRLTQQTGHTKVTEATYAINTVKMTLIDEKGRKTPTQGLQEAIDNLCCSPTDPSYDTLLDRFGIAYVKSATFGARARILGYVETEYSRTESDSELTVKAETHLAFIKAGGDVQHKVNDTDETYKENVQSEFFKTGGDPTLADNDVGPDFAASAYAFPEMIPETMIVGSISELISDSEKVANVSEAINIRLGKPDPCNETKTELADMTKNFNCFESAKSQKCYACINTFEPLNFNDGTQIASSAYYLYDGFNPGNLCKGGNTKLNYKNVGSFVQGEASYGCGSTDCCYINSGHMNNYVPIALSQDYLNKVLNCMGM